MTEALGQIRTHAPQNASGSLEYTRFRRQFGVLEACAKRSDRHGLRSSAKRNDFDEVAHQPSLCSGETGRSSGVLRSTVDEEIW
jgi:hypothetical protein